MEEKYFAASNSGKGFKSFFGEIFDPYRLEHIYIIKGGPGTGKSYFMKSVAKIAEEKGKNVVYYYCSSDQNSLDGIIIDGKTAVLDGTAPHDTDAVLPGAAEDIVDLGAFWDSKELERHKSEIVSLNADKSRHYKRAYKYLEAYHSISEALSTLTAPFIDHAKIEKCVSNIMRNVKSGFFYDAETAICGSVGMEGCVRFSSLEEKAEKIYVLADLYDTSCHFLRAVANTALAKKLSVTLSYDPINSDRLDAVYLKDSKILFTSNMSDSTNAFKKISMQRFINTETASFSRASLKNAMKLRELMLEETVSALQDVKKTHFKIEDIYI
ncbi:MAG: hypothetical protein U0M06_04710, partial [Clostridia bacterium]|nr:hypothetical protein [Clostridia bacterium]